jgi:hypothetical protein
MAMAKNKRHQDSSPLLVARQAAERGAAKAEQGAAQLERELHSLEGDLDILWTYPMDHGSRDVLARMAELELPE